MKKKGKFNLNTGNTLKFGKYKHEYKHCSPRECVIIKRCRPTYLWFLFDDSDLNFEELNELVHSYVDDGELQMSTVPDYISRTWGDSLVDLTYSMNKHRRWLLLDVIREACKRWDVHKHPDFRISAIERHISPRYFKKNHPYCLGFSENKRGYPDGRQPFFPFKHEDCASYSDNHLTTSTVYPVKRYSWRRDLLTKGKKDGDVIERKQGLRKVLTKKEKSYYQYTEECTHIPCDFGNYENDFEQKWMWNGREWNTHYPEIQYEFCYPKPLCGNAVLTTKWKSGGSNYDLQKRRKIKHRIKKGQRMLKNTAIKGRRTPSRIHREHPPVLVPKYQQLELVDRIIKTSKDHPIANTMPRRSSRDRRHFTLLDFLVLN